MSPYDVAADDLHLFKQAVDSAYDHIVITDLHGTIIYANKAACQTTGYALHEIIGNTPRLWGGLMEPAYYKKMWTTIKEKKLPFIGEVTNMRKDGNLYTAEVRISPMIDKATKEPMYFVGIERDITDKKESDMIKTEFVSLASHQLRTPLSTLNWYSEILLGGDLGGLNDSQSQYINEIYDATRRMIGTVNDLLNMSRIELGKIRIESQMTDIREIVQGALADNGKAVTQKKLTIKTKYTKGSYKIAIDPQAIGVIITNLIANAIKYTPPSGTITITTSKDDLHVNLIVEDNGYGIPKLQQRQIFSKFFRADNIKPHATAGTGLGLYITKAFVEFVQGTIRFESTENKGTTFYVRLPLTYNTKHRVVKPTAWIGPHDTK